MWLERVAVGDVIKARIKGRSLWGEVTEVKAGIVYFSPISAAAGWRHASAREIIGHWRKAGRRAGGRDDDDATRPSRALPAVARPRPAGGTRAHARSSATGAKPGAAAARRTRLWYLGLTVLELQRRHCEQGEHDAAIVPARRVVYASGGRRRGSR
jgi:hypothetical protein